jgi:DNA-binding NarL/FixJ family response regulator
MPPRCLLVDDSQAFLHAAAVLLEREGLTVAGMASSIAGALPQDPQAGAADVILISTAAETDYQDLIQDSPAAGFLAKSDLSAQAISHILGHTPHST